MAASAATRSPSLADHFFLQSSLSPRFKLLSSSVTQGKSGGKVVLYPYTRKQVLKIRASLAEDNKVLGEEEPAFSNPYGNGRMPVEYSVNGSSRSGGDNGAAFPIVNSNGSSRRSTNGSARTSVNGSVGGGGVVIKQRTTNGAALEYAAIDGSVSIRKEELGVPVKIPENVRATGKRKVEEIEQEEAWFKQAGRDNLQVLEVD